MTDCYTNPTHPECAPPEEPEPLPPEEPGTPVTMQPPPPDLPATGMVGGIETILLGVLLVVAGFMTMYLARKRG